MSAFSTFLKSKPLKVSWFRNVFLMSSNSSKKRTKTSQPEVSHITALQVYNIISANTPKIRTYPTVKCQYLAHFWISEIETTKGHLISKCLFGAFKFFQKMNENKSTWGIIVVKSNFFVRFLEEWRIPKTTFKNQLTFRVSISDLRYNFLGIFRGLRTWFSDVMMIQRVAAGL